MRKPILLTKAKARREGMTKWQALRKHLGVETNYDVLDALDIDLRWIPLPFIEKRRLLDYVCSNSIWKDGKLLPNCRKPFDLIVDACELAAERKGNVGSEFDETAQNEIWLPFLDDYRTFVDLERERIMALVEFLAA